MPLFPTLEVQGRPQQQSVFHTGADFVNTMNSLPSDHNVLIETARMAEALRLSQENLQHLNAQLRSALYSAEEARRLKTQFAANVSHELRAHSQLEAAQLAIVKEETSPRQVIEESLRIAQNDSTRTPHPIQEIAYFRTSTYNLL